MGAGTVFLVDARFGFGATSGTAGGCGKAGGFAGAGGLIEVGDFFAVAGRLLDIIGLMTSGLISTLTLETGRFFAFDLATDQPHHQMGRPQKPSHHPHRKAHQAEQEGREE